MKRMHRRFQISLGVILTVLAGVTLLLAARLAAEEQPAAWPQSAAAGALKPALDPGPRFIRNIVYAKAGDRPLLMDALVPPAADKPRPMVVFIHGGGWRAGDKSSGKLYLEALGAAGFVAFSIDYRLTQEAEFPAQIHDCKAAIRFVRKHAKEFGGNPGEIGVIGASAGGHLAALLGTSGGVPRLEGSEGETGVSSTVQAVSDWYGPADFTQIQDLPESTASMVTALLGGMPSKVPTTAADASPVTFVDAKDPPFQIIHGTEDPTVPFSQSIELRDVLAHQGVPVELIQVPGGGHANFEGTTPDTEELLSRMVEFFKLNLK